MLIMQKKVGTGTAISIFNAVTYTGNGSSLSVSGVGFQPDFVWSKSLNATFNHNMFDSTRGTLNALQSNNANAAFASSSLTSFDADGFSLGTNSNVDSEDFIAWCFQKQSGVFDIKQVTHTTGVNTNVVFDNQPDLIIEKNTTNGGDWSVYSTALAGSLTDNRIILNSTAIQSSASNRSFTGSTLTIAAAAGTQQKILYAFTSKPGVSSIGSYTGNGSLTGPIVTTGFQPKFLMIKNISTIRSWIMWDAIRDPSNPIKRELYPNLNSVEETVSDDLDFLVDGFQPTRDAGNFNTNGDTYLYLAFA